MPKQITIPALPCASITETLDFYVALGFEVTYQTERPSTYACVKYEDIELHFFTMKGYEPANSYTTCLVLVDDANALHQIFKTHLKAHYGKVAVTGIPRLTRPNNNNASGDYRFNVVDPGGNWIRFIERDSDKKVDESPKREATKLSRATKAAILLLDAKGDFERVATMLDKALSDDETANSVLDLAQAKVLRAEAALNLNDSLLASKLLREVSELSLTESERLELSDILLRASELNAMLE